jgi:hypothetical protein
VLSENEVRAEFGAWSTDTDQSLRGYWDFDGDLNDVARDRSNIQTPAVFGAVVRNSAGVITADNAPSRVLRSPGDLADSIKTSVAGNLLILRSTDISVLPNLGPTNTLSNLSLDHNVLSDGVARDAENIETGFTLTLQARPQVYAGTSVTAEPLGVFITVTGFSNDRYKLVIEGVKVFDDLIGDGVTAQELDAAFALIETQAALTAAGVEITGTVVAGTIAVKKLDGTDLTTCLVCRIFSAWISSALMARCLSVLFNMRWLSLILPIPLRQVTQSACLVMCWCSVPVPLRGCVPARTAVLVPMAMSRSKSS